MSSNSTAIPPAKIAIAVIVGGAALYFLLRPIPRIGQQDVFIAELKALDNIPKSVWDPHHTPRPGEPGWEFNYNRS